MGSHAKAQLITSREDLVAFADSLLHAVRPYASPHHSLITLPGTPGGSGTVIDGLEGFARTFLLAGFRLAGEGGADPNGYVQWYADGLVTGTDPHSAHRWPRPTEANQAKVEAASLALILDLTRPWIWDGLGPLVQEQIVDYLAEIVGDDTFPPNNWLWFRVVVETFLRSVGGPHRVADIEADLARHDSYYERDGWYRDGEKRAYDHYAGWAMHLYPTLWARMSGAGDLVDGRAGRDRSRLDEFLRDAVRLVGGDGSPLVQGRSLVYRFGAAAPFWAGALAEVPSVPLGQLRRAALGIVSHFTAHGVPNQRGLLDLGWWRQWRRVSQWYSGPGSPYWASKGLLGLALPATHPVWTASPSSLPQEETDFVGAVAAPGWAISSTAGDGIARIANHGTDYAVLGSREGDAPLYTRLGYSTATSPLLHSEALSAPMDQAVVLVDAAGRRSHRCGFEPLGVEVRDDVVIAVSRAGDHWLDADIEQSLQRNGGATGTATSAGVTTTISVLRGTWEVRLVRLRSAAAEARRLEAGGWALADDAGVAVRATADRVELSTCTQYATLIALSGWQDVRVEHADDASPLGAHAAVGVLCARVEPGWYALALALGGGDAPAGRAEPRVDLVAEEAWITWGDGGTTGIPLDLAYFEDSTGSPPAEPEAQ